MHFLSSFTRHESSFESTSEHFTSQGMERMATMVADTYFVDLGKADPATLCRGDRCRYDGAAGSYFLVLWGDEYKIDWMQGIIEKSGGRKNPPHEYFYLFIVFYLLLPMDITPRGVWISEKDLPGGTTFFRGPHLLPTKLMSERFVDDLQGFCQCCQNLGGTRENLGDAGFSFKISNDVRIAVVYWMGDEDFPAEAKILFDKSIADALPLDIVYALAVEVCTRLSSS